MSLALVAAAATAVDAGPQRRVGVVVSLEIGLEAGDATAIADALGAALRDELPVDVISGAEVERRLPPDGLPDECVGKPECRNDLGRRLDADELLMIAVVAVGQQINVDATWADVASGRTASRPRVSLTPGADRKEAFAAMAKRYLPHIREEVEQAPKIVVVPAPATPDKGRGERRINVPVLVAGGVAVAGVITGSVLGLSARSRHDDLDARGCREMQCPEEEIDSGSRRALYADIAFGVAAGAAITAGVFYYLSADDEGDDSPSLTPAVGPNQVGVSLGGRF